MTRLAFPSALFPAPPRLTLDIPDTWEGLNVPEITIAAREKDITDRFVPNVVVRVDRRAPDFDVQRALADIADYARRQPEGAVTDPFEAYFGGRDFIGVNVSWIDPTAGTVVQAQLFTLVTVPDSQVAWLIQVTGSVGGSQAEQEYPVLQQVIATLTVEVDGDPAGAAGAGSGDAAGTADAAGSGH